MEIFDLVFYQAIRAIRHPERYGPRRNGGSGPGQSRARGLTRAILDTFPIVKFGNSTPEENNGPPAQPMPSKDVETLTDSRTGASAMELREWEMLDTYVSPSPQGVTAGIESKDDTEQAVSKDALYSSPVAGPAVRIITETSRQPDDLGEGSSRKPARDRNDIMPAAIGRETCPICIMDFEEGDDLRLLPCDGKHRFHQSCVDPWLLELSSSCPICREGEMMAPFVIINSNISLLTDFYALEKILSKSEHGQEHTQDDDSDHLDIRRSAANVGSFTSAGNRFSRYLRFAKRRHDNRREGDGEDPTDPYMPSAPGSSVHLGSPTPL